MENMVKIIHEELFAGIISIPITTVKFLSLVTDRSVQKDPDQYEVVQDYTVKFRTNGPLVSILTFISFQDSLFLRV